MRDLFPVLSLFAALAACDPRIYVDEPIEELPDAGASPDAETPPPPPEPAPQISCAPAMLDFGAVAVGNTQTLAIICSNTGDAALLISQIQFMLANPAFTFTTDPGALPIMLAPSATVTIQVQYSPLGSARDLDTLLINSNDPNTPNMEIEVAGGDVPSLRVDPDAALIFPTGAGPRMAQLMISNVGLGDLLVHRIAIGGPQATSLDDFTILECMGRNPCDLTPPLTLCAPTSASCVGPASHTLTVHYQNDDVSTVDVAELHLETNDPADPDHVVALEAEGDPCFYPTPVITLLTPDPCVGMPVFLSGASSIAGGGSAAAISAYQWSWIFTPAAAPAFYPNFSGSSTTSFIPTESGTHVIGLDVTNNCRARSQAPASETINVAASCP